MSWGTSAEEFIGTWKLENGSQTFLITETLKYVDSSTPPAGLETSFDSVQEQLNVEGEAIGFKADGYSGGQKQVLVAASTLKAEVTPRSDIPTEGERYTHEET